ncbi:MAG TPA: heme ABC transporter ATP-binding protein, partial [Kofleriaceae bacterium]|nr:heme ABC transporter ATP-binding protein [Kofleriaceae bacterium]
ALLGRQRELADAFGLDDTRVAAHARRLLADAEVRPPDPALPAAALSGGNQQKLVVARELDRPGLRLLLAAQPTRGVDVGAIESIHRRILAARDAGIAVLLCSAELSELRALADRILVMYRGRIAASLDAAALAAPDAWDRIGEHMAGVGATP